MNQVKELVTPVKMLVTMGKTIGDSRFLREHVRLYSKFVRQWGVFVVWVSGASCDEL